MNKKICCKFVSMLIFFSAILIFLGVACSTSTDNSETESKPNNRALIIVDVQNDFCPGGSLAVREGDKIVPIINSLQEKFDLVVATQDWHPENHSSFASNNPNGPWPDHCVQGTHGAELVASLNKEKMSRIFKKGTDKDVDSYSGFFDNDQIKSTGLEKFLHENEVSDVYIVGLATDYCIKFTSLDAKKLGFNTFLVLDATRGVEVQENDVEKAIEEMKSAGVKIINSKDL